MPQGGVHEGEDPRNAALRELREIGVTSVEIIEEVPYWLTYDFPPDVRERLQHEWGSDWKGQAEKWYLFRFTGKEEEINISGYENEKAEFGEFIWMSPQQVMALVSDIKKPLYEEVLKSFAPHLHLVPSIQDLQWNELHFTNDDTKQWSELQYHTDDTEVKDGVYEANGNENEEPVVLDSSDKSLVALSSLPDQQVEHVHDVSSHFITDQEFDTREDLTEWCQNVGKELNVVIIIFKSEKATHGRRGRLILGCERGGVYRNHRKKTTENEEEMKTPPRHRRRSSTRKCNCPFELRGIPVEGDKWKLKITCGLHNHELPKSLVGNSYVSRLTPDEKRILVDMTVSGVKPRDVLTTIKRHNDTNLSTMRTIYNAKAKMRLGDVEGRTAMHHLTKLITEKQYVHWERKAMDIDIASDIFWAHPESILLAKCFPSILMLDCIYRTKRSKMPLLEVVGVTSTSKTFYIAFAFLQAEKENNYEWALQKLKRLFEPHALPNVFVTGKEQALIHAVHTVFPNCKHLLCTFHISRDIEQNCKRYFEASEGWKVFFQEWSDLTQSESEQEFVNMWEKFKATWAAFPKCLEYVATTWLPYKENFVSAWINCIKHRGNRTISRSEGTLARLMEHIELSEGALNTVWSDMHNLLELQFTEVKYDLERNLTTMEPIHNLPHFRDLKGVVSHYALDLIHVEFVRAQYIGIDASSCDHLLRTIYGLPCAHELVHFHIEGQPIPLSHLDNHWKKLSTVPDLPQYSDLDYLPEMQLLKEMWDTSTQDKRQIIERKLREIVSPPAMLLLELTPPVPRGRGRPRTVFRSEEKKLRALPSIEEKKTEAVPSTEEKILEAVLSTGENNFEAPLPSIEETILEAPLPSTEEKKPRAAGTEDKKPRTPASAKEKKNVTTPKKDPSGSKYSKRKQEPQIIRKRKEEQQNEASGVTPPIPKRRRRKSNAIVSSDMSTYLEYLPEVYRSFIEDIQDVCNDGNCGYRAVASLMGLNEQTGWKQVRHSLIQEMLKNRGYYEKVFGADFHSNISRVLDCYDSPCPTANWMQMPEMGYLVATTYQCVLVFISDVQCVTFLPLLGNPVIPHRVVSIGFVYRGHYIKLFLEKDAPIPPIGILWHEYRKEEARAWADPYENRIKEFMFIAPQTTAGGDFANEM